MSSGVVISVENLGKKYRIRHQKPERYTALRDVLADKFTAPWRALASTLRNAGKATNGNGSNPPAPSSTLQAPTSQEDFWALREVSFEVKRGEVLGIIGRNGAGKSTLLKLLSRITEPTIGQIEIEGRVASLLEVGTGFHPELTGRENIFLNGAILGMTRGEIKNKFDEIVAFAEVEKFLDTPVKRYSTGMYVRLAFAVAAHLEPEILVVDEVLAVGDAEFQKKCLGKMRSVAKNEGRTVLFVSHNMAAVSALSSKALVLQAVGWILRQPVSTMPFSLISPELTNSRGRDSRNVSTGRANKYCELRISPLWIRMEWRELPVLRRACRVASLLRSQRPYETPERGCRHWDHSVLRCPHVRGAQQNRRVGVRRVGPKGYFRCTIQKLPLAPGSYSVNLILRQNEIIQDWLKEAAVITVEQGDFFGNGKLPTPGRGGFLMEQTWSFKSE